MIQWTQPYPWYVYLVTAGALIAVVVVARRIAISAQLRRWWLFVPRLLVLGGLLLILLSPTRRDETRLPPRPARVTYLVDTSRSMSLDRPVSRLDQVKQAIAAAERGLPADDRPRVAFYRFGEQLAAAPSVPQLQPLDAATRLGGALLALPQRFEQDVPKAVVVFSDGTRSDQEPWDEVAAAFRHFKVPVHVFPVGDKSVRGDVAIQELIVPRRVASGTKVSIAVTIGSHGFDNQRVEVQIRPADQPQAAPLATLPITLSAQPQRCELVVEADRRLGRLQVEVPALEGEAILENNRVPFQLLSGDRRIRVLYMEGTVGNEYRFIHDALVEDPNIECVSMVVNEQYAARPRLQRVDDPYKGYPATREELFQYDVVICSDISRGAFTREQLDWTAELVGQRGGGFAMVGGHTSFGAGKWDQTVWDQLIPVDMSGGTLGSGYYTQTFSVQIPDNVQSHPIWRLEEDPEQNRQALALMPVFYGTNIVQRLKPAAILLGTTRESLPQIGQMAVFSAETYGRGRTFAMSTDSTAYWGQTFERQWGRGDNRYFRKFWRNVIHWLSENSIAGNKRLHVETDKVIYRPGEPIRLDAIAYDESYQPTTAYQLVGTLRFGEADSAANESPAGSQPTAGAGAQAAGQQLMPVP
ncbi:MAG: hypothetical protein J5I93_26500, partial [Pirellulaceae bacterium]|nr:hypothetical protein [Pirellulaceae bacterium]